MTEGVKVQYSPTTQRVRITVSRQACLAEELPPEDILRRVASKLESVQASGLIESFILFPSRLQDVWRELRQAKDLGSEFTVHFTVAQGINKIPGLEISVPDHDNGLVSIAFASYSEQIKSLRWEPFKAAVMAACQRGNITTRLNSGELFGCYIHLRTLGVLPKTLLGPAPVASRDAVGKAVSILSNKQRHEVYLHLRDLTDYRDQRRQEGLLASIKKNIQQLNTSELNYEVLDRDFYAALTSALSGPEALGLELPLVLLIASAIPKVEGKGSHLGLGRITFKVSPDAMEASIQGFDLKYYSDSDAPITLSWIEAELLQSPIKMPMTDEVKERLSLAMSEKADLNNMVICHGRRPVSGGAPSLYLAYQEVGAQVDEDDLESGQIDIRKLQQRNTVKPGQLIAEVRFQTPPSSGMNVYGEEVAPQVPDETAVRVGDGVEVRDRYKFFALRAGMPLIVDRHISLKDVLTHNGDVNLRTGDIDFDGGAFIKGNIDTGSKVELSGDLLLDGSVLGGKVRVKGGMTVKAGINTGPQGFVEVKGDLKAEFIENSLIICHGNLKVYRGIINSRIFVGGHIKVVGGIGVIVGGHIVCFGSVFAGNIGNDQGSITELNVGTDWRKARSIEIKRQRIEHLHAKAPEYRAAMRDIVQLKPSQLTPELKNEKDEMQRRLIKIRELSEKLEAQIQEITATIRYNKDAVVLCEGELSSAVSIKIGGHKVPINTKLARVAVVFDKHRSNYFMPFEAWEDKQRAEHLEAVKSERKVKLAG